MFCTTCHSLAVTRAGETKIDRRRHRAGTHQSRQQGESGLAGSMAARSPGLFAAQQNAALSVVRPGSLSQVTQYIESKLTDPDLLSRVPRTGRASGRGDPARPPPVLGKGLRRLPRHRGDRRRRRISGPTFRRWAAKTSRNWNSATSKIPRNLIAYIQAKITDPVSVNAGGAHAAILA